MEIEKQVTIKLCMSENEASKLLMMLSEVSSIKHEIPDWAHKTCISLIKDLEDSGVE